jgi:hypothetical protein
MPSIRNIAIAFPELLLAGCTKSAITAGMLPA